MSKPVKQTICKELNAMFRDVDAVMVVDPTRLDGITANAFRRHLATGKVQMQLVKNSLIKRAVEGTQLANVVSLLDGPCAFAWGGESIVDVAKLIVGKLKELPNLVIKGAVMEGLALDAAAATALSKMSSKAELRSSIVGQIAAPGRKLAAAILAAGSKIANVLKGRIEALEKTEKPEEKPAAA